MNSETLLSVKCAGIPQAWAGELKNKQTGVLFVVTTEIYVRNMICRVA